MANKKYMKLDVKLSEYKGRTIYEVLKEKNIDVPFDCGGRGICRKCKVGIGLNRSEYKSDIKNKEIEIIEVIACKHRIYKDTTLYIKNIDENYALEESDNQKNNVELLSNISLIEKNLEVQFNHNNLSEYAIAIDIGTTTIEMGVIEILSAKEVFRKKFINPQKKYGQDIFSRIEFSQRKRGNFEILRNTLLSRINNEINLIDKRILDNITSIAISANCTMTHIFLGKDISCLGRYPYQTDVKKSITKKSDELGLALNNVDVILLPQISAFIGGDIVSGSYLIYKNIYMLNKGKEGSQNKKVLFIDIGTNGEIVLFSEGSKYATSCAAGPALEGMNISCGSIARKGVIEAVDIDDDFNIKCKIIGNKFNSTEYIPIGICGSGVLSIVSESIKRGIIDSRGKIKTEIISDINGKKGIYIFGEEVFFLQEDYRQVQLSKAAILSAIKILLSISELDYEEIDRVFIAGQFGGKIDRGVFTNIGILPREFYDKIEYIGNSSLLGAYEALIDKEIVNQMDEFLKDFKQIELSTINNYDRVFVDSMKYDL